jgi:branched-chain amino acid transport system ATP-binding protein
VSDTILATNGLTKEFRGFVAVNGVDLTVRAGTIHALIGPNGAGKTSFLNLVTGRLEPSGGQVLLRGEDVTRLSQARRVKQGLARTFQLNTLFRGLSVIENVALAVAERSGGAGALFSSERRRRALLDEAYALLQRVAMAGDALSPIALLPYGRQRLVEIAIALALDPKVLLLDEPAAGVPSAETGIILDAIESLPPDMAVLVIEHDMELVFRFARRITVLVQGAVLVEGTPAEIAGDARVQEVYLGEEGALWPAA